MTDQSAAGDPLPLHETLVDGAGAGLGDTEGILLRVTSMIANAKTMPLSSSAMLANREEVLELLEEAVARLPEELRRARHLLREREEFLAKAERDADEILEAARAQAERMVSRSELVRQAEMRARQVREKASEDARRMRHEVEDFCDQKLATFEAVLDKTKKVVLAGRERLQVNPMAATRVEPEPEPAGASSFFDQDQE